MPYDNYIDEYKADPQARTVEAIRRDVVELNYPSVAGRLYARALCQESLPIDLLCELIPRMEAIGLLLVLFRLADGNRIDAIIRLLETDAFPADGVGMQAAGVFAIAANQLGPTPEQRERLAAQIRVCASVTLEHPESPIRRQLLAGFRFVASQLEDTCLAEMTKRYAAGTPVPVGDVQVSVMLLPSLSREDLLALPAHYDRETMAPFARKLDDAVTFAPTLPRNQLCWCDSGKKFKRCHGADVRPTVPPVQSPRLLSKVEVQTRPLHELARMRLDQLGDEQLASAIDRLVKYRAWDVAERGLDAFEKREHIPQETRDRIRDILIGQAIRSRCWELARKHAHRIRTERYAYVKTDLEMALPIIERGPQAMDHLLAFAAASARNSKAMAGGVGVILQAMPALGILLLRADAATDLDAEGELLTAMNQARAELGLSPGDPVEATLKQWQIAKAKARDADAQARLLAETKAEVNAVRDTLADTVRQNRELTRRMEDLERQLRDRPAPAPPVEVVADPAELRALRLKLEQAQEVVREKNLELAELRRALRAEQTSESEPPTGSGEIPVDEDDDERWVDSDGAPERRVRIPSWRPALLSEIQSMPPHVAREAVRTVAQLATSEVGAWRGVRRPKRSASPVHMARVGIHHRLLFCFDHTSIDVMELVTRESLYVALKRYA